MRLVEGGDLVRSRYVHPRVEPEIAYIIGKQLAGDVSPVEALAAVEAIAPAVEIIDSRFRNFKFTLPDVVADNASSSGFILGAWAKPGTDVSNTGIVMEVDGRPVQIGSSAAILGNPIRSLVAAARAVAQAGERLEPGDIVLAGGATAAHPLTPGELSALGSRTWAAYPSAPFSEDRRLADTVMRMGRQLSIGSHTELRDLPSSCPSPHGRRDP